MFDIMFDTIFNWIAKNRAKRELLKLYRMVKEKKRDILYSCDTERFRRYYDETELLENALAYILYTKFDVDTDRDVVWDYQYVNDTKMQEYIDGLLESDKETYNYAIDAIDKAIEVMSDSVYKWDGYHFLKYY